MYPDPKEVAQIGRGRLYIMGKPSGGENLEDDLKFMQRFGITRIVSLLEPIEASELGLASQNAQCQALGLGFLSVPVADRGTPIDKRAFLESAAQSYEAMLDGHSIVAHCRAGIGRSGLFCSAVLMLHGHSADSAMSMVSAARGLTIPDTEAQIEWIQAREADIRDR